LLLGTVGGILFLVAEFINIQAYFYDNLKLFTYAFLLMCPLASIALDALFSKKYFVPIGVALLGLQIYTATQDYVFFYNRNQSVSFFTKEEFDLTEKFKSLRTSSNALVLINPKHNHWIPALAGNPVLMGYPGWLWTWGISYSAREAEVNEMLSGGSRTLELLTKNTIEYAVLNDQDKVGKAPVSVQFFSDHFPILINEGQWHVFKIK